MKNKWKVLKWKLCILVLGILLLGQLWKLCNYFWPKERAPEHFVASQIPQQDDASGQEEIPEPFTLTNMDHIRVIITNKEDGSIYHEEAAYWQECTQYRGTLEIVETKDGYVIINELPVEEYLYSVVPSEMPANYPVEALKAQAICARTYAYLHILTPAYEQWNAHVDDTTAFQVYHSVEEQERTTQAVNETEGIVLLAPNGQSLAQTYYYSTSCGYGSDAHVWRTKYADSYPYIKSRHINRLEATALTDTESMANVEFTVAGMEEEELFAAYIKTVNSQDYEAQESWYRWSYEVEQVDLERMLKTLQTRYEANKELVLTLEGNDYVSAPIEELERLVDLVISKREAGGVADELLVITEKNVYKVITQQNIRYVLNDGKTKVTRQDGTESSMPVLLPSGFFVLENTYENGEVTGYSLTGGGYGHGVGMSQNAAKVMAGEGMNAQEILTFFFEDCTLIKKQ